jgi:hypothetical protein
VELSHHFRLNASMKWIICTYINSGTKRHGRKCNYGIVKNKYIDNEKAFV